MKKFYATLVAVAVSASSMFAFEGMTLNTRVMAPEKAPKAISEMPARATFNAPIKKKATSALKPNRVVSPTTVSGSFVSLYQEMYPVTGYEAKTSTDVVTVTIDPETNEVSLEGYAGWYDGAYSSVVTYSSPIKGTYENGVITVPDQQVLGAYDGNAIVFFTCDEDGEELEDGGQLVWDPETGTFEADFCTWLQDETYYWGNPGFYPTLTPANGKIEYATDNEAFPEVEQPVYYSIFDDDEDGVNDTFMVSGIMPFGGGYVTYWPIDPESEGTLAEIQSSAGRDEDNNPIPSFDGVAFASESSTGLKAFSLCCTDNNYFGTFLFADLADPEDIVIPAEGYTFQGETAPIDCWYTMDLVARSYYGTYERAHITAVDPEIAMDGIENIVVTENNTTAPVYYNIQGARVSNPATGLYILVKDGKASRVYVK